MELDRHTSWLDVMKDDVERSKHRLKLCRRRVNRWALTVPKVRVLKGVPGEARMRTRTTATSWEKKWPNVFIEMHFEVGIWSPEIMCCCGVCGDEDDFVADSMPIAWTESQLDEKEVPRRTAVLGLNDCKDDNDNEDKMVVIVSRLMTFDIEVNHQGEETESRNDVSMMQCCGSHQCSVTLSRDLVFLSGASSPCRRNVLSASRERIEIESDLERIETEIKMDQRHRVVVLARMNMRLGGVSTKSVQMRLASAKLRVTPALIRLDKERTSLLRRPTMRASYVASNRRNARAMREMVRFMSETSEGACSLECLMSADVRIGISLNVSNRCNVISEQRDMKVSCKTDIDHAELEFNERVEGVMILLEAKSDRQTGGKGAAIVLGAKRMKIDFGAGRIGHLHCPMLLIQECANLICMEEFEEKYNTVNNGTKVVNAVLLHEQTFGDVAT